MRTQDKRLLIYIGLLILTMVVFFLIFLFNLRKENIKPMNVSNTQLHQIQGISEIKISDLKSEEEIDKITSEYKFNEAQKYELSCELNSTAIILGTLGMKISEDNLISLLKDKYTSLFSPAKMKENGKIVENTKPIPEEGMPYFNFEDKIYSEKEIPEGAYIWGDPDKGFVGKIDGGQRKMTGYGINEGPIVDVFNRFGYSTIQINKETLKSGEQEEFILRYLLSEVGKGNFVQLWGDYCTTQEFEDTELSSRKIEKEELAKKLGRKNKCNPRSFDKRDVYWFSPVPSGGYKLIKAFIGEHNFILTGYKTDGSKITHIKVYDTYTGFHTYQLEEWLRKWSKTDYRGIIIKKNK